MVLVTLRLGDASIPAPAKRQEPWRYTDLQTLFKTDDESHKKAMREKHLLAAYQALLRALP